MFVTQEGVRILHAKRQGYIDELRSVQGQKGPAAEEGTWHDNFSFESLVRQEGVLSKQILDVGKILNESIIVPSIPQDTKTLQVGHIASLYIVDDDVAKEVVIGGYGETDFSVNPPIVDYNAPLVAPFFGYEQGHEATVFLGGVNKCVILDNIKLRRR